MTPGNETPIEDHGIIGNMRTAALVGVDGAIDWFCTPRFDSPSVFAAVLDTERGGAFRICVRDGNVHTTQHYWPGTNVLVTRFLSDAGVVELEDFMPLARDKSCHRNQVVRRVRVVRGEVDITLRCAPAFDYGRAEHTLSLHDTGALFRAGDLALSLASSVPLRRDGEAATAEFCLEEGGCAVFVLETRETEDTEAPEPCSPEAMQERFEETVRFWRTWLSQCTYEGRWREIVHRSALALKLMTYEPTGAIVAAPTTSLPEELGGGRNWDYRYTWLRDAAFTLYGLMRIGFVEEARDFMEFLRTIFAEADPRKGLDVLYGLHPESLLEEAELSHLRGHRGSAPVRIGNAAHDQLQLDIYGELIDSIYLYNKHGAGISYDDWRHVRDLVTYVCDHWEQPDEGIWEPRNGRRDYVYSKLMCWVAIDRGLRLADKRSLPADRTRWLKERDRIYERIMAEGFDAEAGTFTQTFGGGDLDAALLIMPLVFFVAPDDPRILGTIDAIRRSKNAGGLSSGGLIYRYRVDDTSDADGIAGTEGTFNMCSFWLVEALTRAGKSDPRRLDDARMLFERMLTHANHLGLYAEETGPRGEALGNFPQAFTHLALISAAFNLDRALG